jgi:hypothetical protein
MGLAKEFAELIPEQELTMRLEGGWDESDAKAGFKAPFPVKVVDSLDELPANDREAQVVLVFDEGSDDPEGVLDFEWAEVCYAGENEDWDGATMSESTSYCLPLVLMSNLPEEEAKARFRDILDGAVKVEAARSKKEAQESLREAVREARELLSEDEVLAIVQEPAG